MMSDIIVPGLFVAIALLDNFVLPGLFVFFALLVVLVLPIVIAYWMQHSRTEHNTVRKITALDDANH